MIPKQTHIDWVTISNDNLPSIQEQNREISELFTLIYLNLKLELQHEYFFLVGDKTRAEALQKNMKLGGAWKKVNKEALLMSFRESIRGRISQFQYYFISNPDQADSNLEDARTSLRKLLRDHPLEDLEKLRMLIDQVRKKMEEKKAEKTEKKEKKAEKTMNSEQIAYSAESSSQDGYRAAANSQDAHDADLRQGADENQEPLIERENTDLYSRDYDSLTSDSFSSEAIGVSFSQAPSVKSESNLDSSKVKEYRFAIAREKKDVSNDVHGMKKASTKLGLLKRQISKQKKPKKLSREFVQRYQEINQPQNDTPQSNRFPIDRPSSLSSSKLPFGPNPTPPSKNRSYDSSPSPEQSETKSTYSQRSHRSQRRKSNLPPFVRSRDVKKKKIQPIYDWERQEKPSIQDIDFKEQTDQPDNQSIQIQMSSADFQEFIRKRKLQSEFRSTRSLSVQRRSLNFLRKGQGLLASKGATVSTKFNEYRTNIADKEGLYVTTQGPYGITPPSAHSPDPNKWIASEDFRRTFPPKVQFDPAHPDLPGFLNSQEMYLDKKPGFREEWKGEPLQDFRKYLRPISDNQVDQQKSMGRHLLNLV